MNTTDLTSDEALFLAWFRRLPSVLKQLVEDALARNDAQRLAEGLTLLPPDFRQRLVEDMGRLANATEAYKAGQQVSPATACWAADQAQAGGLPFQQVAGFLDRATGRGRGLTQ